MTERRGGSRQSRRRDEWNWTPSSGEGAASALNYLKRAERVKDRWRDLEDKPRPPAEPDMSRV